MEAFPRFQDQLRFFLSGLLYFLCQS